jgi:hypothetical protein
MRNRLWASPELDAPKRVYGSWAIIFYRLGNHFALIICTFAKPGDFATPVESQSIAGTGAKSGRTPAAPAGQKIVLHFAWH